MQNYPRSKLVIIGFFPQSLKIYTYRSSLIVDSIVKVFKDQPLQLKDWYRMSGKAQDGVW
jgi:hypothetical protein